MTQERSDPTVPDGSGASPPWTAPLDRDVRRADAPRPQIVYLDPRGERPVSAYSPEGEIRMMGEFAAGLSRRRTVSRPVTYALVLIVLLPIVLSLLAVLGSW